MKSRWYFTWTAVFGSMINTWTTTSSFCMDIHLLSPPELKESISCLLISNPYFQFKVFPMDLIQSKNYWNVPSSAHFSKVPILSYFWGTWGRVGSLRCGCLTIQDDIEATVEIKEIWFFDLHLKWPHTKLRNPSFCVLLLFLFFLLWQPLFPGQLPGKTSNKKVEGRSRSISLSSLPAS